MAKRHFIQDYSENFRGNTETRTVASDFIKPSIGSSLTRRGKKRTDQHVDMWWGKIGNKYNRVKGHGIIYPNDVIKKLIYNIKNVHIA